MLESYIQYFNEVVAVQQPETVFYTVSALASVFGRLLTCMLLTVETALFSLMLLNPAC